MHLCVKKLSPTAMLPKYGRDGDAGLDLFADDSIVIAAGFRAKVRTGISLAIPEGFVGLIWDRSGMATLKGLTTLAGVVDGNYRGEVFVTLLNVGGQDMTISRGDKIAQMLIQMVSKATIVEVEELADTNRGAACLGSSGQ